MMKKTIFTILLGVCLSSPVMAYSSQAEDLMVFLNRHLYGMQIPQSPQAVTDSSLFTSSQTNPYGVSMQNEDVILSFWNNHQQYSPNQNYAVKNSALNESVKQIYQSAVTDNLGMQKFSNSFAPAPVSLFAKPKKGKILLSKSPPRF